MFFKDINKLILEIEGLLNTNNKTSLKNFMTTLGS